MILCRRSGVTSLYKNVSGRMFCKAERVRLIVICLFYFIGVAFLTE